VKVLLLDNFDSFTYNLFHYLEALDCDVTVARNNAISIEEIASFDKIVLSPGPGLPADAGQMMEIIRIYASTKPILGVCLGMQALGEFFGGTLYNQSTVKHGITEQCRHNQNSKLFHKVPEFFDVGLYHSWAVDIGNANQLEPTAFSENEVLMAFEHKNLPVFGVQFHPESLMTVHGKLIIQNFIEI
jgi:anthranilate synthase component II